MDKRHDISENTETQNPKEGNTEKVVLESHSSGEAQPDEISADQKNTEKKEDISEATDHSIPSEKESSTTSEPPIVPSSEESKEIPETTTENQGAQGSEAEKEETETHLSTEEEPTPTVEAGSQKAEDTAAEQKGDDKETNPEISPENKNDEPVAQKEEEEILDYSHYGKEELTEVIISLKDASIEKIDKVLKKIKPLFDAISEKEKSEAFDKFIQEGGEEDNFSFKSDELTDRFDANYKILKERKQKFHKEKEEEKEKNLFKKEALLEKLREFIDADDNNMSFNTFKEMQEEWKAIGPIPGAHVKTLWANYNALVDRFYDNRSIYFELKELDRKKNLEAKLELCEKAEQLSQVEVLKDAIKELNELHNEFKHIGPVPKADQEPLWERFKSASDAVYARRKEYIEELKISLEANLVEKEALGHEVQSFTSFDSDRIKEWNEKTKEILGIQKKWEAIGGVPKDKAKEINKKFWSSFKTFFNNKSHFFKKLDAQREDNLKKKETLVEAALSLQDSENWSDTASRLKVLQKDWREIGPVPEKYRDDVYNRFKAACDHFFNNRRSKNKELESEYEANLTKKNAICDEIEKLIAMEGCNMEDLKALQNEYTAIGFVPRNAISSIKKRYNDVVEKFIGSMKGISDADREKLKLENQINKFKDGPNADQKIHRKEQAIRKQINQVENDIALWKNNIEFFAHSKTADKLKEEFNTKIEKASDELKNLKKQLKIIRDI